MNFCKNQCEEITNNPSLEAIKHDDLKVNISEMVLNEMKKYFVMIKRKIIHVKQQSILYPDEEKRSFDSKNSKL